MSAPVLTAGNSDPVGDGWLRLNKNTFSQSTIAYYDTALTAAGSCLSVNFDFANWDCKGADGFTFFLMDGSNTSVTAGGIDGALGYSFYGGVPGVANAWLAIGFDNFGNFSSGNGGPGQIPNSVVVRGSGNGTSGYKWVTTANVNSYGQLDFPSYTTRPSQSGPDFRHASIKLDADNVLTVAIQFGATGPSAQVLQIDLDNYAAVGARPATWKLGFTASTNPGEYEIHEVRNLVVESCDPLCPVVPEPSTCLFAALALGTLPLVHRSMRRLRPPPSAA